MVDVHDEYRPTGYSRTYPNLMTAEGIRGDEARPRPTHDADHRCSRACWPGRRTTPSATTTSAWTPTPSTPTSWPRPCASSARGSSSSGTTGPLLAWRKVTGRGPARPTCIGDEPELEFFDRVPDRVGRHAGAAREIGEYAVIARRSGEEWFVGGMNADGAADARMPLTS